MFVKGIGDVRTVVWGVLGSPAVVLQSTYIERGEIGRERERESEIALDVDPRGSTVALIRASGSIRRRETV